MSSRSRSLPVRVACVGILVVAMGGVAGAGETTTPARAWAKSVCTGLTSWTDALDTAAGKVRIDATAPPAKMKAALTRLFKRLQQDTTKLSRLIDTAGAPKVDGGAEIAEALRDDLAGVSSAIADARAALKALSTDDATAFNAGASAAYASVTTALDAVPAALDEQSDLYSSAPLRKAMRATRACRALVNP